MPIHAKEWPVSSLEREDALPVVLHADDYPALLHGHVVHLLTEGSDRRIRQSLRRTVCVFALRVVVQHRDRKPRAAARLHILQHLLVVGGGVAEGRVGSTRVHQPEILDLSRAKVIERQLGLPYENGPMVLIVAVFERLFGAGDLLGEDAVNLLRVFAYEARAATGRYERPIAV